MRVAVVAGARPNFVKIAPLLRALRAHGGFDAQLIHTGQHYDDCMSAGFFRELEIPDPDYSLQVGSGSHAVQTAGVMTAFDSLLDTVRFDLVVVVGDVNSTLACSLVAAKRSIPIAHVEAGLRSRDWSMPEEVNRVLTDALSVLLFTPSREAGENLIREGRSANGIKFVGNVMVDTLLQYKHVFEGRVGGAERLGVDGERFALLTLHRPSNVDHPSVLRGIMDAMCEIGRHVPVVYPMHPRSRERLRSTGMLESTDLSDRVRLVDPLSYLDFVALESRASVVMTDSGGVQEETTVLGVPCLTLRPNTERPATVTHGTNRVVGTDAPAIVSAALEAIDGPAALGTARPELWDGRTAERIVDVLANERERILHHERTTS